MIEAGCSCPTCPSVRVRRRPLIPQAFHPKVQWTATCDGNVTPDGGYPPNKTRREKPCVCWIPHKIKPDVVVGILLNDHSLALKPCIHRRLKLHLDLKVNVVHRLHD